MLEASLHEQLIDDVSDLDLDALETQVSQEAKVVRETIWFRVFFLFVSTIQKLCFWFNSYCGFGIYLYFNVSAILAPFFGLTSGITLLNPLLIISCSLQMFVGYPFFEVLAILPYGIYKQAKIGEKGFKPVSFLHRVLNSLNDARDRRFIDPSKSVAIFFTWTIVDLFILSVFLAFFVSQKFWAMCVMFVLTVLPILSSLIQLAYLFLQSWIVTFIKPISHIGPEDATETDKDRKGWPMLKYWERYMLDSSTEPFSILKTKAQGWITTLVFLVLWVLLIIVNIVLLVTNFDWIYLVSSLINVILLPFYLRFHILKLTTSKEHFESHTKLRAVSKFMLKVAITGAILYLIFIIKIALDAPKMPTIYMPTHKNETLTPIKITTNNTFKLPSQCHSFSSGYNILEIMVLADISYAMKKGKENVDNYLSLAFGSNWSSRFNIDVYYNKTYGSYVQVSDKIEQATIFSIKGDTSYNDAVFSFSIHTLHNLPGTIYDFIPFNKIIMQPFLDILMMFNPIALRFYDPVRARNVYSLPFFTAVQSSNSTRILALGHSSGGAVAKSISFSGNYNTIGFDSPIVRPWLQNQTKQDIPSFSRNSNILSTGSGSFGAGVSGRQIYIPYNYFSKGATLEQMICISSIQCGLSDRFLDFCNQTLGEGAYLNMKKSSPFNN